MPLAKNYKRVTPLGSFIFADLTQRGQMYLAIWSPAATFFHCTIWSLAASFFLYHLVPGGNIFFYYLVPGGTILF